jgi:hypothetical protein
MRGPETPAALSRRLAAEAADVADADQWAIVVDGVDGTGPADVEAPVAREWLEYLNGHRPATYRLTLPLCAGYRQIGLLRLGTSDPRGFGPAQITRARAAADRAGEQIAAAMDRQPTSRQAPRGERAPSSVIPLDRYRVSPTPTAPDPAVGPWLRPARPSLALVQ